MVPPLQARGLATGGGGYVRTICAAAKISRRTPGKLAESFTCIWNLGTVCRHVELVVPWPDQTVVALINCPHDTCFSLLRMAAPDVSVQHATCAPSLVVGFTARAASLQTGADAPTSDSFQQSRACWLLCLRVMLCGCCACAGFGRPG